MTFTLLMFVMSVLVIAEIALNHRQQSNGIAEARRQRQRVSQLPSISVIRPVRGADVGAAENYAAALDNGYPGEVETIFVFDEESDPGYPIAVAAVEAHTARRGHGTAQIIVSGQPPRGVTSKLHAMMVDEADPHERAHNIAMAKVGIGQAGRFVSQNAVQLHGGMGMTEDLAVGHYFRRCMVIERLFGDTAHYLAKLAADVA